MNRKEAFIMAIEAEIRAQKLYSALAKAFKNTDTATVFDGLVLMERDHEDYMRKLFAKEFPTQEPSVKPQAEHELKGVKLTEPMEVLEFAMSREDLARSAYLSMAETSANPEVKKTLLLFADQEEEHKEVILAEMQKLQGATSWYDPSELNGLMED